MIFVRLRILFLAGAFILTQCTTGPATSTSHPTPTPVSSALAAQLALDELHSENAVGRLLGAPTMVRGRVMSFDDAYALVNGKPMNNDAPFAYRRNRSVWLVVTRGTWLLHIPGGHGDPRHRTPTVLAKDVTVSDLWYAVMFDAATGQVYDRSGVNEIYRIQLSVLPELPGTPSTPQP